jgi:hypothetical protein
VAGLFLRFAGLVSVVTIDLRYGAGDTRRMLEIRNNNWSWQPYKERAAG